MNLNASHSVVLFDDTFNPFHILHFSTDYAAHVVPALSSETLRDEIRTSLSTLTEQRHTFFSTGTYVQSSGPRFETKAEISFFRQFGVRTSYGGSSIETITSSFLSVSRNSLV